MNWLESNDCGVCEQGFQADLEGVFRHCVVEGFRAVHILYKSGVVAAGHQPAPSHRLEQVRRPDDGQSERDH